MDEACRAFQSLLPADPDRADEPWLPDNANEVFLPRATYLLSRDRFGDKSPLPSDLHSFCEDYRAALQRGELAVVVQDRFGDQTDVGPGRWKSDMRTVAFEGVVMTSEWLGISNVPFNPLVSRVHLFVTRASLERYRSAKSSAALDLEVTSEDKQFIDWWDSIIATEGAPPGGQQAEAWGRKKGISRDRVRSLVNGLPSDKRLGRGQSRRSRRSL